MVEIVLLLRLSYLKEKDEEKVYHLLIGLNDIIFGIVRSSIIQQEPMSKIKLVYVNITKEEEHQALAKATAAEDQNLNGTASAIKSSHMQTICSHDSNILI